MSTVSFFLNSKTKLTQRRKLKAFIADIFKKEGYDLELLNIITVSDEELLEMNNTYLKHNYYTDIITFDLSNSGYVSGELYISIDRVYDNAASMQVDKAIELCRVIFHGCLHLCGYSDKNPANQKKMRARENHWLKKYELFHVEH